MSAPPSGSGAVVVGGYVNALDVVRSLASTGASVSVIRTERFDIAHRSRWCSEHVDLAGAAEPPNALRDTLVRNRSRWRGRVVFPTTDAALLALAALHDELPEYRLVAPSVDAARVLLEKDRLEALARDVGIATPVDYGPAEAETSTRTDLQYPVVVKPVTSHLFASRFGCKLFVANNRPELADAVRRVGEAGLRARILEFVPGGDDAFYNYCVYIDTSGVPAAGLAMHKLRKSPPFFGVCRVAEPWLDDSLRAPTLALLKRIGYRGMANAEYKLDPRDGTLRLMEVNGRPFLMAGLARRAGIDMIGLAWAEKTGTTPPPVQYNGWRGSWIHLHADLLYALLFRKTEQITLRGYLAPYLRSPAFAVESLRDPLPALAQWSRTLGRAFRAVFSSARRLRIRQRVQEPLREPASRVCAAAGSDRPELNRAK